MKVLEINNSKVFLLLFQINLGICINDKYFAQYMALNKINNSRDTMLAFLSTLSQCDTRSSSVFASGYSGLDSVTTSGDLDALDSCFIVYLFGFWTFLVLFAS